MNMRKIVSIQHQIVDIIRSEIISGELSADSKLTQQYLAERFGVSRGSVREVLLILRKEGLTYTKTSTGHYVAPPLNPKVNTFIDEVRNKIECFVIKEFLEKSTYKDIDILNDMIHEMTTCFSRAEYTELVNLELDFYKHHIEKIGGSTLLNVWQPLVQRVQNDTSSTSANNVIEKYTKIRAKIQNKYPKTNNNTSVVALSA